MKQKHLLAVLLAMAATALPAQTDSINGGEKPASGTKWPAWLPHIGGTIRAKAEYQTSERESRFEVRNARVDVSGDIVSGVLYKAEIDLSDEGAIKMRDAYAEVQPFRLAGRTATRADGTADLALPLALRIGQMRVPFSIDAHRSPWSQYFANRSFLAKQVGDVRDVGLMASWRLPGKPLVLEAGVFNGSGLTDQKDFWTKSFNFSAKVQVPLACGLTLQTSMQKVSPTGGAVYLYDGGATLRRGRWTLEGEYQRKHYTHAGYKDVNALDAFVCYTQPLRGVLPDVRFLLRFDAMGDHSDGNLNAEGRLQTDDAARKRLTGGITLGLARKLRADLRLNYEKYFYDQPELAKPSERDKLVLELMVHFP